MKLPRGFGKNYFSLSAITATVNQITLHQESSRVQNFHFFGAVYSKEADELEESEEIELLCSLQFSQKSCHCNSFFTKLTYKTLKQYNQAKKSFKYQHSLHTDISPP